jgi:hypothetical protein
MDPDVPANRALTQEAPMNGAIRPAGPPRPAGAAAFADNRLEWRRLLALK